MNDRTYLIDESVVSDFDMDAVMDNLIDGVEDEIGTMSLKELHSHAYTEATRELIVRSCDMPINSFDITALEMAEIMVEYMPQCTNPIELDTLAKIARDDGVYPVVAREIAEQDRVIVTRIGKGVYMVNGRAKELVWTPGYYRRMYQRGYREVAV